MPAKHQKRAPDTEQVARFVETARALGCDEDEAAFDEKLKVIARHKPTDKPETPQPAPKRVRKIS